MPKYRVMPVKSDELEFESLSGTAIIVEADSERLAIQDVAGRFSTVPEEGFQAERVILSNADRHEFLHPGRRDIPRTSDSPAYLALSQSSLGVIASFLSRGRGHQGNKALVSRPRPQGGDKEDR